MIKYSNGQPIRGGDYIEIVYDGKTIRGLATRNAEGHQVCLALKGVFKLSECSKITHKHSPVKVKMFEE